MSHVPREFRGDVARATGERAGEPSVAGKGCEVFFFFSNRLGCLPSLLLSLVVTAVLVLVLF